MLRRNNEGSLRLSDSHSVEAPNRIPIALGVCRTGSVSTLNSPKTARRSTNSKALVYGLVVACTGSGDTAGLAPLTGIFLETIMAVLCRKPT